MCVKTTHRIRIVPAGRHYIEEVELTEPGEGMTILNSLFFIGRSARRTENAPLNLITEFR